MSEQFDFFSQMPPQIDCIISPINGKGGLYLGNYTSAYESTLKEYNINTVISVIKLPKIQFLRGKPSIQNHLHISADDSVDQQITQYFDQAYDFIEANSENSNILIHCFAGISRSTTILLSFLMKKNNWDYEKAYLEVKKIRCCIDPNQGFQDQLKTWQK